MSVRRPSAEAMRCHAIELPLSGSVDEQELARRLDEFGGVGKLWVERVPFGSGEPAARRRRALELGRPVSAELGIRAVLVSCLDGQSSLLLVANREVVGTDRLRRLASAAGGGQDTGPPMPGAYAQARAGNLTPARGDTGAAWGLGDPRAGARTGSLIVTARAEGAGATPGAWLAAVAVLLSRYERRDDLVIATFGAGPTASGLPLRVNVPANTLLGELAERLTVGPAPAPAPASAATVAVSLPGDEFAGVAAEYLPFLEPPYPLTITLSWDTAGAVQARIQYWLRSVSPEVARQFAGQLVRVHSQVSGEPWLRAGEVDLLGQGERDLVIAMGRPARSASSRPRCLHAVFAERVAERPDAVAVTCDGTAMTYRELDRDSNALAHGIRRLGVRDNDLVGVCVERSAELIAVLLGVLKAGAVYVPMDPAHPAERLAYLAADARVGIVITARAEFPGPAAIRVVTPSRLRALGRPREAGPPRTAVTPADPAYVIYTSGSTGRPKGVVIPHANVTSLLAGTATRFAFGPRDVWTFFHSVAFDFSVWEIWICLLTGGRLIVVPYWVSRSPQQFRDLLAGEQVTVLSQTPSAFAQLLEADRTHPVALGVRLVIFGGEPLPARMLLPWLDRYPESRCELVNMFGITETTVHVTEEAITRRQALEASRSVGKALPGWHLYVLDQAGRPVPPGVVGEIYVGGSGVAAGYLHRPGLTSQRFLPDPFAPGRMYRSGDLGRFLLDGSLEHLGRLDDQISLRGFRIELGEIRSVLLECPGVTAAAVVVRQDDISDPATARVDAYVVLSQGSTREVRTRAARLLPEHMMPAAIMVVPALPLTANGKVDVAALAEVSEPQATQPRTEADPGTGGEIAEGLLSVWRQILGVQVGPDDNFFELGGNSLLAIRMAAAMAEAELPPLHPRVLYLNPTVRHLADALRAR